jgi:hypothetical protein
MEEKIFERLVRFSEQRKPATLTSGKTGDIFQGRFRSCSLKPEFIEIEVLDSPPALELEPGENCTVIFADGFRTTLFVSPVLRFDPDPNPLPRIRIAVPDQLERTEARHTFRVPLHAKAELQISLRTSRGVWHPRPLDISVGGVLVQMPLHSGGELTEDDELTIDLNVGSHSLSLEAFAQHRWGPFYAIYFSEVLRRLRRGDTSVPEPLLRLVDALEDSWLADRDLG